VNEVRAVLLDLGHTLVDYEVESGALLTSYRDIHEYLAQLGLGTQPVSEDLMLRVSTRALDLIVASYERGEIEELDMLTLFDEALRHHGWHLEPELVWELLRREHAAFATHLRVPPETLAALTELRRRGYLLGIVSNATLPGSIMREDLDLLGLTPLIDAATFSSEAGVRKPDRRIFDAVLDALELDPRTCLFVGDRLKEDVGGSRALGMRAVLTHEFRQETPAPDHAVPVIERLPELLGLLDGQRA
jgi:HAD superfamily hydrolase (TIGR01549 family)